tara:strand:+ start:2900 stop:3451 length:552 start_codon:yes stop_codon:yes gene_type:complete
MSEENKPVDEIGMESTDKSAPISPDVGLIAESKKYRTRAQQAEAKLAEFQKKLEEQETAKLKEQQEWKTLAEQNEAKLNDYAPYKEKYETLYNANKERLLNKFPEDQREKFKDKDPDWLESLLEAQGKNNFTETSERASVPQNKEHGGFSSNMEWLTKDPEGYEKAKAKQVEDKFGNIFMPKL